MALSLFYTETGNKVGKLESTQCLNSSLALWEI
jgi:hypothetical protein